MFTTVCLGFISMFGLRLLKYMSRYICSAISGAVIWPKYRNKLVVVYGANTPIGIEVCRQLADKKVRLLMIGDDEEIMMSLQNELYDKMVVNYQHVPGVSKGDVMYEDLAFMNDHDVAMVLITIYTLKVRYCSFLDCKIDRIINTYIRAVSYVLRRAYSIMVPQATGHIVVFGPSICDVPEPYNSMYSSSVTFAKQLTTSLYYEGKDAGVKVEFVKFSCVTSDLEPDGGCMCKCEIGKNVSAALSSLGASRYCIPRIKHTLLHFIRSIYLYSVVCSFLNFFGIRPLVSSRLRRRRKRK